MARDDRLKRIYASIHKTIDNQEYKKCRQCNEWKLMCSNNYNKNKSYKCGYEAVCKECKKHPENKVSRKKGLNPYEIRGDITVLLLLNSMGEEFEAYIDTEDLPRLIEVDYCWHLLWDKVSEFYYVQTLYYYYDDNGKYKSKTIYLHRFITNAPKGSIVDHIDNENPLDNRKCNLRITNQRVNMKNRSGANKNNKTTGVRNVTYIEKPDEYWVQFSINYERFKWVFSGDQFEEACMFAEKKRLELYGEKDKLEIKDEELFGNIKNKQ